MTKSNLQKTITVQVIIHALTSKRGISDNENETMSTMHTET